MNKSQAIRDYLTKRPQAGTKEVQEALAKKGIQVHVTLISSARKKLHEQGLLELRSNGRKVKSVQEREQSAEFTPASPYLNDLIQAKKAAESLGGLEKATQLMSDLHQLIHG